MTYDIRYSPEALRDLDAVWDGVLEASGDNDTADRYVNGFLEMLEGRTVAPRSGIPLYYGGLFTCFYSLTFKAYKAFYRVKDNVIEVARILPAKSEYLRILFDKDGVDNPKSIL